MKRANRLIPILLVAGLALGCTPGETAKSTVDPRPSGVSTAAGGRAKMQTMEAPGALREYASGRRTELVAEMSMDDMIEAQAELDRLSCKARGFNAEARSNSQRAVDAACAMWAQTRKRLGHAKSANESPLEHLKVGFRNAHNVLKDSYEGSRQHLSETIAP